jgi:hypothetical protein
MAGLMLAERWPSRYSFDIAASLKLRDERRIECANVWRQAHGLSLLPLPPAPSVRVGKHEAAKVTSIEWLSEGLKPEPSFASGVDGLKGTLLRADAVVGFLSRFVDHPPSGAAGLAFKAAKAEDLTGVQILVRLIPGNAAQAQWWNVDQRVTLGGKCLAQSSGGGISEVYASAKGWSELERALKQAAAAAPETAFEVSVRLTAGK